MQERLNGIKEYFRSIELIDGKWVLCVEYKPKWGAYPSDNGKIKVAPDEKVPNIYWYFSDNKNVAIEDIITLIEETIQTNIDAGKKAELFTAKAKELKELFSNVNIPFAKLKTLKFVFDENASNVTEKKKSTKKTKPKTKKEIIAQAVDEVEGTTYENVPKSTVEEVGNSTSAKVDYTNLKQGDVVNIDGNEVMLLTSHEAINATDMSQDEIDDLRG